MSGKPNRRRDAVALVLGMLIGGVGGEAVDRMTGGPADAGWIEGGFVSADAPPAPTLPPEAAAAVDQISSLEPGESVTLGAITATRSTDGDRLTICHESDGRRDCRHLDASEL